MFGRWRRDSTQNAILAAIGSLIAVAILIFAISRMGRQQPRPASDTDPRPPENVAAEPLMVYCAASNKPVVERVAKDFTKETGLEVQLQFGASQSLLAGIEVSKSGDLYLPADDQYLKQADEKKLTSEVFPLVTMRGVVVVAKGNPHAIKTFDDLLKPDLRVSLAGEAAAIGKVTMDKLAAQGKWQPLADRTQSFKTTVNDVANDVKVGASDAGIVWDAVAVQYKELEVVELTELEPVVGRVAIAVLTTSKQPEAAALFGKYLSASDRGLAVYRELGFQTVEGRPWTDN